MIAFCFTSGPCPSIPLAHPPPPRYPHPAWHCILSSHFFLFRITSPLRSASAQTIRLESDGVLGRALCFSREFDRASAPRPPPPSPPCAGPLTRPQTAQKAAGAAAAGAPRMLSRLRNGTVSQQRRTAGRSLEGEGLPQEFPCHGRLLLIKAPPATRSAHARRASATNSDSVTYRRSTARLPGLHWAAGSSRPQ